MTEKRNLGESGISELEEILGHHFRRPGLIVQALTHRSWQSEHSGAARTASNELLEFLGDAVLGLLVSEDLIANSPGAGEGALSKKRAHLVSEAHLYRAAQRLGLGRFIRLGRGEDRAGGREKRTLLADAMEALLAAVYLDGGLDPARTFVSRWILEAVDETEQLATDYKTELQELLQERKQAAPRYVVIKERGPEHRKTFVVRALIAGQSVAEAEGASKKAAEQAAARIALHKLRQAG